MEKKFAPGDSVRLKTGGPIMTVIDYYYKPPYAEELYITSSGNIPIPSKGIETDEVICEWKENGETIQRNFKQDLLIKVD